MITKKYYLILTITCSISFLQSCLKDEIPVDKHQSGGVLTNQVHLESDYRNQLYYDLETDQVIKSNLKTDWDIAFECNNEQFHLKINASRGMAVAKTNQQSFDQVMDTIGAEWQWDAANGHLDSTAFGDWRLDTMIYIVDMGYDLNGSHLGFKKIRIIENSSNTYEFLHGNLNASTPQQETILIDIQKNYVMYSLINNSEVQIEPNREEWDLYFGQYTHVFHDPVHAYVVTGVICNSYLTEVKEINDVSFEDIDLEYAENEMLTTNLDEIGYDWKYFDFETSSYSIVENKNYIIKTSSGYFYKLRFTDFHDQMGIKGSPKFEFQQL